MAETHGKALALERVKLHIKTERKERKKKRWVSQVSANGVEPGFALWSKVLSHCNEARS